MKDYWLKAEFFKRKIETHRGPDGLVEYGRYQYAVYVSIDVKKHYRRLQKCKLLRTMYV